MSLLREGFLSLHLCKIGWSVAVSPNHPSSWQAAYGPDMTFWGKRIDITYVNPKPRVGLIDPLLTYPNPWFWVKNVGELEVIKDINLFQHALQDHNEKRHQWHRRATAGIPCQI